MRKNLFYFNIGLFVFFLAVSACSNTLNHSQLSFSQFISSYTLLDQYTVMQYDFNSGFAGVKGTGEFSLYTNFTVKGESIISDNVSNTTTLFTMSTLKEQLASMTFDEAGVQVSPSVICYLQESFGTSVAIICAENNVPQYFLLKEYKGNHQSAELSWSLSDFVLDKHEQCSDSRNAFCNVIYSAVSYNPDVCKTLQIGKNFCDQIAAQ